MSSIRRAPTFPVIQETNTASFRNIRNIKKKLVSTSSCTNFADPLIMDELECYSKG